MSDFPSTKFDRGKIFAKTGLKVGKNYAAHYLKQLTGKNGSRADLYTQTANDVFGEFTKLRGTALKIAQSLSIDQGFLPEEFSEVMTQAQYKVPPINRSLVRSIIKKELGNYPEKIFSRFEAEAFAAASIGQVHRAELKDGTPVAVKVQYPGVQETIASDLGLAKTLFKRISAGGSDIDPYFKEIEDTLLQETDYIHEGRSIDRFHLKFAGAEITTPVWYRDYSTERVLTMSYIDGLHLDDFLKNNPTQKEINHYGQRMWDFFHRQIQSPEEIHADTHPGNFMLTPDGKLAILDFGCVKSFPEDFFNDYLKLLPTHLSRNEEEIKKLYFRLGVLLDQPENNKREMEYFRFCLNYGFTFAMPYHADRFDFGDPEYKELIRGYTKNAPLSNKPRGSKHFIYSTRVHLGLYHFLMKLGAEINTGSSRDIVMNKIQHISAET